MPPRYQGIVFQRGRSRGGGRGRGREGGLDPFLDTKLENVRKCMESQEGDKQLRQGRQNQVMDEVLRVNQQMLR